MTEIETQRRCIARGDFKRCKMGDHFAGLIPFIRPIYFTVA